MTTAIGYFNAGCGFGGLLGLAIGGWLITDFGWRYAFWYVGVPQLLISVLLATTVRQKHEPTPSTSLWGDVWSLAKFPSFRFMMQAAFLSGLMSGNHRFISALVQRLHHVTAQEAGSYMGVPLGLAGVAAAWTGGHTVDHFLHKSGDSRMLFWCASTGDIFHMIFYTCALLAPKFWQLIVFLMIAAFCAALNQGIDTATQQLGRGRRATTQAILECGWSIGMAVGPFVGGLMSDSFEGTDCDGGCALAQSLLIVSGLGLSARAFSYMMASVYFRRDVKVVDKLADEAEAEATRRTPRGLGLGGPRPLPSSSPSRGDFSIGGDDLSHCENGYDHGELSPENGKRRHLTKVSGGLRGATSDTHFSGDLVNGRETAKSPQENGEPRATCIGRSDADAEEGEEEGAKADRHPNGRQLEHLD